MFNIIRKEIEWGGRTLTLETGKIARQADGAVLATYGETVVLCTIVSQKKPKEDVDFFPLTVHYREMAFAAGKIPGGFYKREGRPSEKEVLTSRLIDRPIRPLFPDNFYNETQIICTVISHDMVNDPDIVALVGASAAIAIAGVPFQGPLAAARVGYKDGEFILNPTLKQITDTDLDLIVAGTQDSVLMVESEAKELSEQIMLDAVVFGHKEFQPVINMIKEFASEGGKEAWSMTQHDHSQLAATIDQLGRTKFTQAYQEHNKQARSEKLSNIRQEIVKQLVAAENCSELTAGSLLKKLEQDIVRQDALNNNMRIDGRDSKTIRNIVCDVDVLPKTHGSALFTRGETQALVVTTLGTTQDEQTIDKLEGDFSENFMLHYNFPPYSVGESTQLKPPGRREIGHGKLAWRALHAVMPTREEFPYTVRIVSEITESNGSSSMATVCGASLAMMDAGVPVKYPVAGIAMGLIKEGDKFVVLSDIMGDEDHLGDMDFKVAGTANGVTALQMDIKISGINTDIMRIALSQARDGLTHILGKMNDSLNEPRSSLNRNAPTITSINIPKEKIREVIGSGGSVIRKICEMSGAKIDIEDSGLIKVAAVNDESSQIALKMIEDIVLEPEVGKVYEGKVVRIVEFGAFVNFLGGKDGLVHISEIAAERIGKVEDVIKEGDVVKVIVLGMDRGKVKLSMRMIDQATGEPAEGQEMREPRESSRDSRGGRSSSGDDRRGSGNRDRGDRGDKDKRKYYN